MSEHCLHVDGGMGGGQALRMALALSASLGRPFAITNIGASRRKAGLTLQQLCAVKAMAAICGAQCRGAESGSTRLIFTPGPVKPGEYVFDTQGAGSCTLVLQAILPPLLFASGPSRLTVRGATHTYKAPPFEFFAETLLPVLEKLGPRLRARLDRHGFASGGGSMTLEIIPTSEAKPLELHIGAEGQHELPLSPWEYSILAANLPEGVADYEAEQISEVLFGKFFPNDLDGLKDFARKNLRLNIEQITDADGPGNVILCKRSTEVGTRVLSAHGGVSRESARKAATEICARLAYYLEYWGSADRYLTDQLVAPLAVGRGGFFFCQKPTSHAQTAFALARLFTGREVVAEQVGARTHWRIEVPGRV